MDAQMWFSPKQSGNYTELDIPLQNRIAKARIYGEYHAHFGTLELGQFSSKEDITKTLIRHDSNLAEKIGAYRGRGVWQSTALGLFPKEEPGSEYFVMCRGIACLTTIAKKEMPMGHAITRDSAEWMTVVPLLRPGLSLYRADSSREAILQQFKQFCEDANEPVRVNVAARGYGQAKCSYCRAEFLPTDLARFVTVNDPIQGLIQRPYHGDCADEMNGGKKNG